MLVKIGLRVVKFKIQNNVKRWNTISKVILNYKSDNINQQIKLILLENQGQFRKIIKMLTFKVIAIFLKLTNPTDLNHN